MNKKDDITENKVCSSNPVWRFLSYKDVPHFSKIKKTKYVKLINFLRK